MLGIDSQEYRNGATLPPSDVSIDRTNSEGITSDQHVEECHGQGKTAAATESLSFHGRIFRLARRPRKPKSKRANRTEMAWLNSSYLGSVQI